MYKCMYKTPSNFSDMIMCSDGEYLTGLWFVGSNDDLKHTGDMGNKNLPIFEEVRTWLDIYFSGKNSSFTPKYKINDLTPFREEVFDIMNSISYGDVLTYNDIAKKIAKKRGIEKMSSQAVGGAVGWNPICIIVPCHRVVGANGNLTGYAGGINNKIELLKLEGNDMNRFFVKKK